MCGSFDETTDFDPHPFHEYILHPMTIIQELLELTGNLYYQDLGFLLKLRNCDEVPLFLDTYDFCEEMFPEPTLADIQPNDFNVHWYSSETSPIPLPDNFPIQDGQVFYMEKITETCPTLVRQPVQMNILPPPPPPTFEAVQPCYFEGMKLSDLNIIGENLKFYNSLSSGSINASTTILPNTNYYVTQTINGCESTRFPIPISILNLITRSATVYICDNGNDNEERINLSNYITEFTTSTTGYNVSYHTSFDYAFNNTHAIADYQNYLVANNQTVYLRIFSLLQSCFEVVELTIGFSLPPEILEIQINDLAENNSITVLPQSDNYLYSLNGFTYQESNYFDNLSEGQYWVYVKDKEQACEPVKDTVFLLAYPKFFTPNGDGINEKWRIKFSTFQELLNVEIYDRYGKLIAFFDKDSMGWDGTHQGKPLPATDYWFKVIRMKDREVIYRGHFSLVR